MSFFQWSAIGSPWLLAGSLFYLAGIIVVTMVFNVPLNDALAAVDPASAEASTLWVRYLNEWVMWNHVRTVAGIAALASFIMAQGKRQSPLPANPASGRVFRLVALAIGMAEIAVRVDDVADQLFELRRVRKTAVALAVPDQRVVASDREDAAGARHKRDLAKLVAEGGEKFLRHPGRTQQPLALRAVGDADDRKRRRVQAALSLAMVSSSTSKLA